MMSRVAQKNEKKKNNKFMFVNKFDALSKNKINN